MSVLGQAARCAVRTTRLLAGRHLHVPNTVIREPRTLPDGRSFVVFRETTCDVSTVEPPVVLAVWFRLRFIPPGARIRRWLFERLCIVNTLLFAGFEGYLVKLWMVEVSSPSV